MPIRNPFKKSVTAAELHEQNLRDAADKGFKTVEVNGIKAIEIIEPTAEYQLSGEFGCILTLKHKSRNRDATVLLMSWLLIIIQRLMIVEFTYRYVVLVQC